MKKLFILLIFGFYYSDSQKKEWESSFLLSQIFIGVIPLVERSAQNGASFNAGRADSEELGGITFFSNSFKSKEELLRILFHEKQHVEQFRKFGAEYVQENRVYFEQITEVLEEEFIFRLKKEGRL